MVVTTRGREGAVTPSSRPVRPARRFAVAVLCGLAVSSSATARPADDGGPGTPGAGGPTPLRELHDLKRMDIGTFRDEWARIQKWRHDYPASSTVNYPA